MIIYQKETNGLIKNIINIMRIKSKKKLKIYFSMDQDLHEIFEKHIDDNILDKSRLIEKLIEEYMKKNQ